MNIYDVLLNSKGIRRGDLFSQILGNSLNKGDDGFLGDVEIDATGDYKNNYYCDAKAYIVEENEKKYLKITGKWYSKGNNVAGNVTTFPTNINVGAQSEQITIKCYCYYNTTSVDGFVYATYNGKVATDGTVHLMLGHENCYRTFNQYDHLEELIELKPV